MVDVRGLDPRFAPSKRLSSVRFLTYSGEEIKKISCKRITNPNTFDSLLHPNIGGLYDSALGPCDKSDLCGTCSLNYVHCPGHMGHLPLPLPVYHPLFFLSLYQLLRSSCWVCHRLLCTPVKAHLLVGQLELLSQGLLSEALALEAAVGYNDVDSADKAQEGADNIIESITLRVQSCRENAAEDGVEKCNVKTKNLIDLRRLLVNGFLKYCSSGVKTCPYCSAPVRAVRQENHVRIFLKPLARKNAGSWVAAYKKEMQRKKQASEAAGTEKEDEPDKVDEQEETGSDREDENAAAKLAESLKDSRVTSEKCTKQQFVSPLEVQEHIKGLWENQGMLMDAIFGCMKSEVTGGSGTSGRSTADMFFLDVVPVPPSRFRPIAQLGDKRFENPQTANLHRILVDTIAVHELMVEGEAKPLEGQKKKTQQSFLERLQSTWLKLQYDVNCFMDSSSDKKGTTPNGVKQILEKKEGLFRKNMMGKRVDFAARSVISPDPYINMDEIGIPMVFATRLTYPQPVTHWNVKELRQAVINGPKIHPGATHVQNEDGSVVLLSASNPRQRNAIAKRLLTPSKEGSLGGAAKKVFRHLKNGDVLLVNRQPTLHKPSIMAHKARVLPGEKTLRLHYANCKSYNADFDGDEMNAHFPQNELARAEAYGIVSTHHQYLVPKDGTPLSGLIQDHVVSGLLMTIRGRMFNRADYMQLVYNALPRFSGYLKTLPPCLWKPAMLWSGKQVVSTVLLNIIPEDQDKLNLTSKAKIAPKEWSRGASRYVAASDSAKGRKKSKKKKKDTEYHDDIMTESEVIFCQGELLCGVLDKSQFGASQYGFVHSVYELYGGAVANLLLSALGRLFTSFLQLHGFTLGVEDILVLSGADGERRRAMEECKQCGPLAAAEAFNITDPHNTELISEKYEEMHRSLDGMGIKTLDFYVKKKTDHYNNLINTACVPAGLHKPFPSNSLQLMVQSGAKGSTVNCMQISCLLGQIELEGQRPPLMLSGRFLPSFLPYDTSPRAGGFVDGRFLTGIRPQEYFFHCMAGREGLVDTAVKTSRSGYLQRCLIKHLEGICVSYDLSIRDSDGSVIQFLYGEDGLDISKTRFLSEKQFPFLINNYEALCYQLDTESAIGCLDSRKVPKYQRKVDRWVKKHGCPSSRPRPHKTAFLDYYDKHLPELQERFSTEKRYAQHNYRTKAQLELIDMWYGMSPMARESCQKKFCPCPIPVNAQLGPDRHFGAISEKLTQQMESFVEKNPNYLAPTDEEISSKLSVERFYTIVQFKGLRGLADPGEAVGLLAAQSVGEPSTQMTLNTFHFAGRGEMNVTLGIPRLREILMTASPNIKTPAMDVPLLATPTARDKGEALKKLFTRVCLSEVLEKVEVWESIHREGKGHRHRLYKVKLSFLPEIYYASDFDVTPTTILSYVERKFIKLLVAAVKKEIKLIKDRRSKSVSVERAVGGGIGGRLGNSDEGGDKDTQNDSGAVAPDDEEEEDLSDIEEGDDADATSAKQLSKKQQHASYDDPGESDEELINTQTHSDAELSAGEEETTPPRAKHTTKHYQGRNSDSSDDDDSMDVSPSSTPSAMEPSKAMDQDRVQEALQSSGAMVNYCYDVDEELWCQFTLRFPTLDSKLMMTSVIGKLAPKAVVHETPSIKKGYLSESTEPGEKGVWRLKTDGVNLKVLWKYADILNLNQAYTNNIHAMANAYGIEAACKAIIKEISSVFRVYGIAVDYRHLSLIADYMTFDGTYKPFNRIGIEANSSPFQKMSFETTMHFLKSATIAGDSDPIKSPSACLVAGRVVNGGTGSFELLQTLY